MGLELPTKINFSNIMGSEVEPLKHRFRDRSPTEHWGVGAPYKKNLRHNGVRGAALPTKKISNISGT